MKNLELNQMEKLQGGAEQNGWLCGAGVLIVIVGWEDPLAVLAGGLMAYEYC